MLRNYGYSLKGVKSFGEISAIKHNRTTVIGSCLKDLLTGRTLITSSLTLKGTTNGDTFALFLEKVLIPTLTAGQYVVLDNAKIHKTLMVRKLIEKAGCHLLYLPPYSPDFNPIEKLWSALKRNLRSLNTNKSEFDHNLNICLNSLYS